MLDCAEALEHLKKEIKKNKKRERDNESFAAGRRKKERERERVKGEDKTQYVDSSKPYKYIPPKRGVRLGVVEPPLCHPSSFTFFFFFFFSFSLTGGGPATTRPAGLVVVQPPQWPKGWPATPYGWIGHLLLSPFFFFKKKKNLDLKI
jgi:hypothetical protein